MKRILTLIALVLLISCDNKNATIQLEKNKVLSMQIMQTHDDAMKFNAYILKLKRMVNNQLDSIGQNSNTDSLKMVSALLYKADRKMLDWMHHYREPNLQHDSAINYLNNQKLLIDEVHNITFEAIKKAEKALNLK
ncbi:MAG: hypothetical protein ACK4K9_01650 [Bacteroidia bacterium]